MLRSQTLAVALLTGLILPATLALAQTVPSNFSQTTWKSGMSQCTAMAWAKDGTDDLLFVTQKSGEIRVIKNGNLQGANVATVGVTTNNECGLDNVIVDPSYSSNKYIYVFATVNDTTQRVLRFTITNGATVGVTGAPMQIGPDLPTRNQNHDGGGMAIGADGYLYVGIGNLGTSVGADGNTDGTLGEWVSYGSKILRMNRMTGAAISTNPWYNDATHTDPKVDYFFAKGFRNPFGLRMRPGTNDLWLTEVGDNWEQVFLVTAGSTQGYPTENNTTAGNGKLVPVLAYATNSSYGGCLTRGAFYTGSMFPAGAGPAGFSNTFFFTDYKSGKLMRAVLNAGNNGFASHAEFVTGNGGNTLTDVNVGPDGALYYSSIGGQIYRLAYTGTTSQSLVVSTSSITVTEGSTGSFQVHLGMAPSGNVTVNTAWLSGSTDVTVTGGATLTFTTANWMTNQTVTVAAAQDSDTSNESATVRLTSTGVTSVNVTVNVTDNDSAGGAPVVTISGPTNGQVVSGTKAEFYGSATTGGTLDYAEFYVDGVLKYTDDYVAGGHFHYNSAHLSWNTTALSNGSHTLLLKVFDTGGLSGSTTVTVTVDNSAGNPGLVGQYYSGMSFGTLVMSRIDPGVNFDWGPGSPDTSVPVNGFSVRWTGEVVPAYTETYTFYARTDDGVRLWVRGTKVIDNWVDKGPDPEVSGTISLTAGQPVTIVLEYFENAGGAVAQFSWSSPTQPKGIIPSNAMGTEIVGGGGGAGKSSGGGGGGCGLTGLEGVIGLGLAAAFRRRRR